MNALRPDLFWLRNLHNYVNIRKVKKNWWKRKKRKVISSFYSFDRIHKRWWAGGSEGGLEKVWKRGKVIWTVIFVDRFCIWLLLWRHSYNIYERHVNRVLWMEALAAQRPVVGSNVLPHAGQGRLLGDPFSGGAHFGINIKDWYIAKQRLLLLKETKNHSYFWFLRNDDTSTATQPIWRLTIVV